MPAEPGSGKTTTKKPPAASGPPAFTPAPPKQAAAPGAKTRAADLFKQFPAWKKYWPTVQNAAYRWKVDPIELLALLIWENGRANPKAKSSAGALGLAQILDAQVRRDLNPVQYDTFIQEVAGGDSRITDAMKENSAFAIQYAGWRMAGTRGKYASLDEWYRSPGYNPGFKGDSRGPGPSVYVKNYQPSVPQTPAQAAGAAVDAAGAKVALTDPWVIVDKKTGRLSFSHELAPPKGVVNFDGAPLTRSQFSQAWKQNIDPHFESMVGRRARPEEAAFILARGWSQYTITQSLAKSPAFLKGPLFKAKAPSYESIAADIYGAEYKVDRKLLAQAIANSWDGAAFGQVLRKQPAYVKSVEFKTKKAQFTTLYQSIYGTPDANAQRLIAESALGGWSEDQFGGYLRAQPAYTRSPDYQARMLSFLSNLGLISGQQAVLRPGAAPTNPNPGGLGPLPDDPRIKGKPAPPAPTSSLTPMLTTAQGTEALDV